MKELINEVNNIFDDPQIIDLRIDPFAGSVLNKITALNTSGVFLSKFTEIISEFTPIYNPFHEAMLKLPTDLTSGKGSVEVRSAVVSDFQHFVSNFKGMVKDKYFKTHHNFYIQFYTNDTTEYNAMNKSNALSLITRYATAVHTHVLDFTPDFDARAISFVNRYTNATDDQDITSGNLSEDRSVRNSGRDDLNEILFQTFNFCKYIFKADYTRMHNVFPLETLVRHSRNQIEHLSGTVNALNTVNAKEAIYDETIIALVQNKGAGDILVGIVIEIDTPVDSINGILIKSGKSKSFKILSTGSPADHFLNVTNINLTENTNWEIDIFEQN